MINTLQIQVLLLLCFLLSSQSLISQKRHIPGEFLVLYHNHSHHASVLRHSSTLPHLISIEQVLYEPDVYLYRFDPTASPDINDILSWPQVRLVEPNVRLQHRINIPDDPLYDQMWHLEQIMAAEAWDIHTGGTNALGDTVVIGIFDSGYQLDHPDLKDNIWKNYREVEDGLDNDQNGYIDDQVGLNLSTGDDGHKSSLHGTTVAGICGAVGDNGLGVVAPNWTVKIMLVSISDDAPSEADFLKALAYFREQRRKYNESNGNDGAFVVAINTSLGIAREFPESFPIWCEIYESLGEQGILSVVATANEHIDVDKEGDMPTNCPSPYIIGVTSSDLSDQVLRSTAFGIQNVDLVAPGRQIYTTIPGSNYTNIYTGTSLSAPMVSSSLALMHAAASIDLADISRRSPAQSALIMKQLLLENVDDNTGLMDMVNSGGRLNLYRSVVAANEYQQQVEKNLELKSVHRADRSGVLILSVSLPSLDPMSLRIIDMSGREVYEYSQSEGFSRGDNVLYYHLPELFVGYYLVEVSQGVESDIKAMVLIDN